MKDGTRNRKHSKQETGKKDIDTVGTVMMLARQKVTSRTGAANLEHHSAISRSDPGLGFFL